MTNTLSKTSPDYKLAVAEFTGEMETPGDLKDIGQDLEVTANDYTASLPVNVNTEYRYIYKLQVIREEII